jgi:hypothetical protein
MGGFDNGVADICASINEHPDRRYPLRQTCE